MKLHSCVSSFVSMPKMMLSVVLLATAAPVLGAHFQEVAVATAAASLPPEITNALAATPTRVGIFPVSGVVTFPDQVLKVDELVFQPGSRLELSNTAGDWVAIVARRVRFINPTAEVTIARGSPSLTGTAGTTGSTGATGRDGNHNGGNGFVGGAGGEGGPGRAASPAPHVYIYAGEVAVTGAAGPLSLPNLRLEVTGYDGGAGGVGGAGGRGGNGAGGRNSRSNTIHCTRGAGDGGSGGPGGAGGVGSTGGAGGSGSAITVIASQANADLLTSAMIMTKGGAGGAAGAGGPGGAGGGGGSGGRGSRHCGGADRGGNGRTGPMGQPGIAGQPGLPGKIEVVPISSAPAFLAN